VGGAAEPFGDACCEQIGVLEDRIGHLVAVVVQPVADVFARGGALVWVAQVSDVVAVGVVRVGVLYVWAVVFAVGDVVVVAVGGPEVQRAQIGRAAVERALVGWLKVGAGTSVGRRVRGNRQVGKVPSVGGAQVGWRAKVCGASVAMADVGLAFALSLAFPLTAAVALGPIGPVRQTGTFALASVGTGAGFLGTAQAG